MMNQPKKRRDLSILEWIVLGVVGIIGLGALAGAFKPENAMNLILAMVCIGVVFVAQIMVSVRRATEEYKQ